MFFFSFSPEYINCNKGESFHSACSVTNIQVLTKNKFKLSKQTLISGEHTLCFQNSIFTCYAHIQSHQCPSENIWTADFFFLKFMLSHLVAYVKQRHAVNMFMEQQRHTVEAETTFFLECRILQNTHACHCTLQVLIVQPNRCRPVFSSWTKCFDVNVVNATG